ncbi:MAG: DUF1353 domain-containing protein [Rhodospirillaceae bacterium]|nr:DUF1353 domain-containing protein [Rhodospirillaceae bacterium]
MRTKVLKDPGPLQVERLPDGRRKLIRCLRVDVRLPGTKEPITVPEGFCMDYSSLPWSLRWLVNWNRVDIAGVVHDYLYNKTRRFTYRTRWQADLVWFRLARSGEHRANWLQAAVGLAGLYLGACWVNAVRRKCTWQHKTVMAIVGILLLGLLAWALCEWQFWFCMLSRLWQLMMMCCVGRLALVFAVLIAFVAAVNLYQSKGRSSICEEDRKRPDCPTT